MTREQVITRVKHSSMYLDDRETADYIINVLEQQPCDCVSLEVYKQVIKERDIAIEQLKELGYEFGEKIRTSDDCVSRAEVLKQMKEWRDCEFVKMTNPYHYLEKRIQSMPPVTPTQSWIPVSERLPEEGQDVLVYYEYFRYGDYNRMWPTYGVGFQFDGTWGGDVRGHKLNVIAWTPLPKPYEEMRGSKDGSN